MSTQKKWYLWRQPKSGLHNGGWVALSLPTKEYAEQCARQALPQYIEEAREVMVNERGEIQ